MHLNHTTGQKPLTKIKQEMGKEVPDYLKTLVESGMSPENAFKIADTAEKDLEKSEMSPDMKFVKQTLRKIAEN